MTIFLIIAAIVVIFGVALISFNAGYNEGFEDADIYFRKILEGEK